MAFIEPMHRNKPNITYLLTSFIYKLWDKKLTYAHLFWNGD